MKAVIAMRVCHSVERGMNAKEAGDEAIRYLGERVKGFGGVIVLDKDGNISHSHNTSRMAVAGINQCGDCFERI